MNLTFANPDTAFDELSCRDETTTGDEITSLKKGLGKLMLAFPVLMKEDEHDMVEWNWELGWDTVRQETQQTIPSVPGLREAERALFEAYWREVNRIRITIECRLDVQPNGHVQEKTAHSNARDEEMHRSRGSNSNLRIEQHADALDRIDTAT